MLLRFINDSSHYQLLDVHCWTQASPQNSISNGFDLFASSTFPPPLVDHIGPPEEATLRCFCQFVVTTRSPLGPNGCPFCKRCSLPLQLRNPKTLDLLRKTSLRILSSKKMPSLALSIVHWVTLIFQANHYGTSFSAIIHHWQPTSKYADHNTLKQL